MDEQNFPKLLQKTTAPFAIDGSNISAAPQGDRKHIRRLYGAGSIEYVLTGKGTVTENNLTFNVKEGDIFLLHAGQYHDYYPDPDDPWTRIWLRVSGPSAAAMLRAYGLEKVNHIPDIDLRDDFFHIHQIINSATDQETIDREGPRLFLELVQKLHEELLRRDQTPHRLTEAEQIRLRIDQLPDGDITLEQLSQEFHFSKQYLIRIFKKRYSITPNEYILNRRIGIAQSLLKKTNLSIKEIANQLHFCDVSYFTDFFHRRTGLTPSEFRKKYR